MALENTRTEEQEGREGLCWTDRREQSGDPSRQSVSYAPAPAGGAAQSTAQLAEPLDPAAEARSRLDRMRFNAVKEELRRAELAFLSAKKLLPDEMGRGAAERIAEALRRCNLSVDSVAKGAAVHHAVEALEGVSKFDPAARLAEFIQIGGRSLALSARALASCGVASIEYWGRQLQRLADVFAGLPNSQVVRIAVQ